MLRAEGDGEVTFLRLARTIAGRPLYRGGAYLAGGVLVDCGPPATAARGLRLAAGPSGRGGRHHAPPRGPLGRRRAAEGAAGPHAADPRGGSRAAARAASRWRSTAASPGADTRPSRRRRCRTVVDAGGVRLEVVETPGHSPDHVCFFERARGWLFTGDLFLAERQRYLRDGRGPPSRSSSRCDACARCRSGASTARTAGPSRTARRPCGAGSTACRRCASTCSTCSARGSRGRGRAAGRGAGRAHDLADPRPLLRAQLRALAGPKRRLTPVHWRPANRVAGARRRRPGRVSLPRIRQKP